MISGKETGRKRYCKNKFDIGMWIERWNNTLRKTLQTIGKDPEKKFLKGMIGNNSN